MEYGLHLFSFEKQFNLFINLTPEFQKLRCKCFIELISDFSSFRRLSSRRRDDRVCSASKIKIRLRHPTVNETNVSVSGLVDAFEPLRSKNKFGR